MRLIAIEEHFRAPMIAGVTERRSEEVFRDTAFGSVFAKLDELGTPRLADMDAGEISMQVLSHGFPATEVIEPQRAIGLARASNDYLSDAVAAHPDRFAAFATLPTAAPDAAADELSRAVTDLGFRGALINGQTHGRFLDAPEFRPIFARAEALGVPIYLHPGEPSDTIKRAYFSGLPAQTARALTLSAWGWHAELGLHALRLILSGIFDEFPGLQIILGHMGELLPFMLARTSGELALAGDLPINRPLEEYVARHFHFTTSGMFSFPPLLCLLLVAGVDRIMFAVDYPFCANDRGRDFLLQAPISDADRHKIAHGNAGAAARTLTLRGRTTDGRFGRVYAAPAMMTSMSTSGGEERPSVIDRVFCVLESCAASGRPLTLVDLAKRTGLPKTTLHRVCWKLVDLGMLSHEDDGFQVSPKLFALGSMHPGLRRLRAAAMPWLHELTARTGWATNLAVLADGRALVVEEVYGASAGQMTRMVGVRLPLHATAIGKALLSGYGQAELRDYLDQSYLQPFTLSTIVRPSLLREQVERIRATRVAQSHEEWATGTSGIAAPVYVDGRVTAAIAVVGKSDDRVMASNLQYVRAAGSRLSRALSPERELVAI